MQDSVRQQLQLHLQAGCHMALSTAAAAAGAEGGGPLYLLPPDHSAEYGMLGVLQQGGALFLSEQYNEVTDLQAAASWRELQQWFRSALGVELLQPPDAAAFILSAQCRPGFLSACSQQEVIKQGQYVAAALVHELGIAGSKPAAEALAARAKQHLQLVLHPSAPLGSALTASDAEDAAAADDGTAAAGSFRCQAASQGLLFWPAEGGRTVGSSWRLQDILLPSEVLYLHPDYLSTLQQSAGASHAAAAERGLTVPGLQAFFTQHLGLRACPEPGSDALQAAVDAGHRWVPLLLMLADIWGSSYPRLEDQRRLQQQLQDMVVSGTSPGLLCRLVPVCVLNTTHHPLRFSRHSVVQRASGFKQSGSHRLPQQEGCDAQQYGSQPGTVAGNRPWQCAHSFPNCGSQAPVLANT